MNKNTPDMIVLTNAVYSASGLTMTQNQIPSKFGFLNIINPSIYTLFISSGGTPILQVPPRSNLASDFRTYFSGNVFDLSIVATATYSYSIPFDAVFIIKLAEDKTDDSVQLGAAGGPAANVAITSSIALPVNLQAGGSVALATGGNVIGHVIVDSGGGGAVTEADGANITLGTKADALNANPAASGSVNANLKGIMQACQAATPAGANVIGGVTTADGSQVSVGAKADAAVLNPASSGGVIAFLKGILSVLAGQAAPTIYNVTLTAANTEYSQAITNAKKIAVSIQGGTSANSYRLAYVTGKVATPTAPYLTAPCNVGYAVDMLYVSTTLYIAGSHAGDVAQIEVW